MSLVVFLRAVNVGGRKVGVAALARDLGMVNLGAAGTFVAPGLDDAADLERQVREALPFDTPVMVRRGAEVLDLLWSNPFGPGDPPEGARRFVSVMGRAPATVPPLPLERSRGDDPWEVRIVRVSGPYAFSLWCRRGPRILYPNEVVEKVLSVPATTRGWDTLLKIRDVLMIRA
jgi:uncharacterized protein (DUF1697 family)